jgi:hypothetical protein
LLSIGFVLLVAGVALPFLMMIQIITPTFLLGFISYFCSMVGLIVGTIGTVLYVREGRYDD